MSWYFLLDVSDARKLNVPGRSVVSELGRREKDISIATSDATVAMEHGYFIFYEDEEIWHNTTSA